MKTGLCTIAFKDRPFEAVLDLAVEAGIDGVEPWGKPNHIPSSCSGELLAERNEAILSRGLVVSQFGTHANPSSPLFETEMEEALTAARAFGTNQVRVWAGRCGSAEADDAAWRQAIEGLCVFSERAEDEDLTLSVEMHGGRLTDTVDGCMRLIEGVANDALRMNYQPLSNETAEEAIGNAHRIAPYVAAVHAQNFVETGESRRSLIREGIIDYAAILQIFRQSGFDGFVEVEFVREEDPIGSLRADAAYLRTLCESP